MPVPRKRDIATRIPTIDPGAPFDPERDQAIADYWRRRGVPWVSEWAKPQYARPCNPRTLT